MKAPHEHSQDSGIMTTHLSLRTLSWLVCLLSALFPSTIAQVPNVTLTFFPDTTQNCSLDDQSSPLSFSTAFYDDPAVGFCLTLEDVFAGNGTERTTTAIQGFRTPVSSVVNVSFAVSGRENWDPTANYSTVLYKQIGVNEEHTTDDSRSYAQRDVSFHANPDCNGGFTSNCRTPGDCEELPIAIRSFGVYRPDHYTYPRDGGQRDGQCKLAAECNAAGASVRAALSGAALSAMAVALLQVLSYGLYAPVARIDILQTALKESLTIKCISEIGGSRNFTRFTRPFVFANHSSTAMEDRLRSLIRAEIDITSC